MIYDCLIIGGGISGLTCGIRCSAAGLNCAILSSGMSSLHFSSGSIDLMGYDGDHRGVYEPFEYLESFIASHPRHPYAKCGTSGIRDALFFLRDQLSAEHTFRFREGCVLCEGLWCAFFSAFSPS